MKKTYLDLTNSEDLLFIRGIEYLSDIIKYFATRPLKKDKQIALKKRAMMTEMYGDRRGKVARYKYVSPEGNITRWEEVIDSDPFDLYSWDKAKDVIPD